MMWRLVLAMLAALSATPVLAEDYAQRLTAVAYDGAMRANVQGDGHVTAMLDGQKLTVNGDFSGLPSAATGARLYSGPGIGVPGPALLDLQLTGQTGGTFQGSFTPTAAQLAALKRGHVYVQINSQKAPEGNLWGWLLPAHPFAGADVPVEGHGFIPQLDVPGNWTEK
jgi:hypothetical protein